MWYVIYTNKRSKPDPKRDANFEPFVRHDYNNWSYWKAIFTHFFFWPRFIIGWTGFLCLALVGVICCIGHDPYHLPAWKTKIVHKWGIVMGYVVCLSGGIIPRSKRMEVDYSKYLGPDWKATYEGAGIQISNHLSSAFDPILHWVTHNPKAGYLGRRENEKIPGVK